MNQILTNGIVLSRTNYQEADRIITLLTPNSGKIRGIAKGVRKSKSKLAGGVELFSVSEIGYIEGKGELVTFTSALLVKHYDTIVQDINRTMLGYELIKLINRVTEDEPGSEYYDLLLNTFEALDKSQVTTDVIKLWFYAQLLKLAGHTPNLNTEVNGDKLESTNSYLFSYDDMAFQSRNDAPFLADHIKILRLAFSGNKPQILQQITDVNSLIPNCLQLAQTILPNHIRI